MGFPKTVKVPCANCGHDKSHDYDEGEAFLTTETPGSADPGTCWTANCPCKDYQPGAAAVAASDILKTEEVHEHQVQKHEA